ncbi:LicD family protein [Alkalispirillum mobile]|uniref:LicD family protein n=2 Tax=Alkalispirillum mobile TaxID=85925 RepID=A0A498C5R9_9GAMM|nr:LicD family protein [Alkalispirillum mobile]
MADWVGGRADRLPPLEAATARLTAKAQVVHQATLADNQPLAAQTLAEFQDEADRLLASLQAKRADTASRMEAENQERGVSDQEQPADFAREDAEAALHDVAQLLPLEQWGWTALSGTFLGIFREGDFLPHDFDIDLGLPAERTDLTRLTQLLEASPLFESVRADHQYRLHCTPEGLRVDVLPVLVKAVHCNGIAVDFSLLYDEGGIWWHGSMMHRWDHTPQELVAYELRGVRILGPRDGDRYLTEGYGDWRTPVRSFNCSSGRHNLVVVQNLLGVCLFLKRLVWHLSNADANGYDAVLAQMLRQSLLTEVGAGAPRFNRHWFDSCPQQRAGGDQHGD